MRATACGLLAYVGPLWSGRWVRFVCELRPGAVLCTLLCARHAKGTLSMRCSLCRSLRDAPAAVFLAAVGGPGVRGPSALQLMRPALFLAWMVAVRRTRTLIYLLQLAVAVVSFLTSPQEPAPQTRLGASDRVCSHRASSRHPQSRPQSHANRLHGVAAAAASVGRLRIHVPSWASAGLIGRCPMAKCCHARRE
jgi:hypothetical protein